MDSIASPTSVYCHNGATRKEVGVGSLTEGVTPIKNTHASKSLSVVDGVSVQDVGNADLKDFIKALILSKKPTGSFYVYDLTTVQRLYQNWRRLLPRVEVAYAVKCNPDAMLVRTLADLGSSFDCASEWEVNFVMEQGVSASRIIFANPCKRPKEIAAAHDVGVQLMTFDTELELEKLRRHAPEAKAVVRIRADDPTAVASLGSKFGAEFSELPGIYGKAKALGVDVVGVCFHIGTGARDPKAFATAIEMARGAFDIGLQHGLDMSMLDIGGGFTSGTWSSFEVMADAVTAALDRHFPATSGIRIIAEPGRYLMETTAILACNIFGVRERTIEGIIQRDYWITDGLHGSFNPMSTAFLKIKAIPLKIIEDIAEGTFSSTVFGPTCNGNDIVLKNVALIKLCIGDWILFANMGAYTSALSSNFNGMHGDIDKIYIRTTFSESS